jgi:transposase
VKFLLTAGQLHDVSFAQEMMSDQQSENFIGDKGYDSNAFVESLEQKGITVVIPPRSCRNNSRDYDKELYRERNLVERFINKIKWFRRIFSRFDKLASRYLAFLHFVATIIWLR